MTLEIGSFWVNDVLALDADDEDMVGESIPALREFANSLEHDTSRAEFLVQATVLQARESFSRTHPADRGRVWLFGILTDLHLERCLAVAGRDKHGAGGTTQIDKNSICAAFRRLSPDEKVVIALAVVSGFKHRKIAGLLHKTTWFVRANIKSGRAKLAS